MQVNMKGTPRKFSAWRFLLGMVLLVLAGNAYSASKTVLVLGDSLSAEYGLSQGAGWVSLLSQLLQRENIDASVVNASISGETTSGGKARLPGLLQKHRPDIVIVELGGNDGLRGLSLHSAEDNLRTMIASSKKTHAKVLLLGMRIPPNYGPQYADRFAAVYSGLAKETGAVLVPFFLEKVASDPNLFQPDRIHPTAAAQPLMLDTVWPYLKSMLKNDKK
jgi:acyl-CoA thioesterase-1